MNRRTFLKLLGIAPATGAVVAALPAEAEATGYEEPALMPEHGRIGSTVPTCVYAPYFKGPMPAGAITYTYSADAHVTWESGTNWWIVAGDDEA